MGTHPTLLQAEKFCLLIQPKLRKWISLAIQNDPLNAEDNYMLQKEFEDQEIWDCVKLCASDKAPGPDGFTMAFYTHCWEVIGKDVIATVKNFHERCVFEKSFKSSTLPMWL